jgi:iron complex outermembrane receptor protein
VENLFDKRYASEAKKSTNGDNSYSAGAPRTALLSYVYNF